MYSEAIRRTKDALARGGGTEAIPLWKELEASPFRADALYHQGVLLQRAGDIDGAAVRYREVARGAQPFEPAAANLLGIFLLRGDVAAARALVDAILPGGAAPGPDTLPELAANIAAVLIETHDFDRAAAILLGLSSRRRATPGSAWNMAVLAFRKGDPQGSRRLASGVPESVASLWPAAASRVAWEGDPWAVPLLEKDAAAGPLLAAMSRNLAAFREYSKGNAGAALQLLSPGPAGAPPPFPELTVNEGILLAEAGRWKEARNRFEQAVRLSPRLPEGWLNLGLWRELYEGDAAAARTCYQTYVTLGGRRAEEVKRWAEGLGAPAVR